jgi:hypothetical protein
MSPLKILIPQEQDIEGWLRGSVNYLAVRLARQPHLDCVAQFGRAGADLFGMAAPVRYLLAVVLLGLWSSLCSARFIVETHSIRVTAPPELKNTYDSSIANFGTPMYGGSLSGTVVFPGVDQDACTAFVDGGHNFRTGVGELPKIVLVDRGSRYSLLSCLFWGVQPPFTFGLLQC